MTVGRIIHLSAVLLVAVSLLTCTKPEVEAGDELSCSLVSAGQKSLKFTVAATVSQASGRLVGVAVSDSDPKTAGVVDIISGKSRKGAYQAADAGKAEYTFTVSGLDPAREYNVRPFIQVGGAGGRTTWGEMFSASTATPSESDYTGHDYVNMGTGVYWATCNVGAESPEDTGKYYPWVSGKDYASSNWGGSWRMPTEAEWEALREKCEWTWTTRGDVSGYEVKSATGNTIFLPAAGVSCDDGIEDLGLTGNYWSSTLCDEYPSQAWFFHFDRLFRFESVEDFSFGHLIRPVAR